MMDLMAISSEDGPMPLYMHTVKRILREMRIQQQQTGVAFNYKDFKNRLLNSELLSTQLSPLKQRLDTLESFMPQTQTKSVKNSNTEKKEKKVSSSSNGNDWTPVVGLLPSIAIHI